MKINTLVLRAKNKLQLKDRLRMIFNTDDESDECYIKLIADLSRCYQRNYIKIIEDSNYEIGRA